MLRVKINLFLINRQAIKTYGGTVGITPHTLTVDTTP